MNKAILGTFKSAETSKGVMIEGWANKAVVDREGDLIPKDAWQLDNFTKNPIILFNHDRSQPIGKAVITEARDEGLYVKAKISQSDAPDIARVRDLIKEGVMNAFSVGFDLKSAESADGFNVVKEAELFEISVVSIPANQDSVFSLTKAYDYDKLKSLVSKNETPAQSDPVDETAPEKPEVKTGPVSTVKETSIEVEVQAVLLSKENYATLEDAQAVVDEMGYMVTDASEDDTYYVFAQEDQGKFLSIADCMLGNGISLRVGVCMAYEKSKSQTVPMPSDAPPEPDSPALMAAKQTNVMLGLVVTELQAVRDALMQIKAELPPKSAPVEVPAPQDNAVAQQAEIVREYMASIKKTLAKIGA